MKRVPPSVRLKEEIDGLFQGAESIPSPEEPPMVGFVGRLARYMLQVGRLVDVSARHHNVDALLTGVMGALRIWSGECDQIDDITLVALAVGDQVTTRDV